jgi:hypothetical protein
MNYLVQAPGAEGIWRIQKKKKRRKISPRSPVVINFIFMGLGLNNDYYDLYDMV